MKQIHTCTPNSTRLKTHTTQIDDGLDLRKAAFECLDILLDAAPGECSMFCVRMIVLVQCVCTSVGSGYMWPLCVLRFQARRQFRRGTWCLARDPSHPQHTYTGALDYPAFLQCLVSGLSDHADVKAPAHHMLARTAAVAPGAVLAQVSRKRRHLCTHGVRRTHSCVQGSPSSKAESFTYSWTRWRRRSRRV